MNRSPLHGGSVSLIPSQNRFMLMKQLLFDGVDFDVSHQGSVEVMFHEGCLR
jgi:hypothetical protein